MSTTNHKQILEKAKEGKQLDDTEIQTLADLVVNEFDREQCYETWSALQVNTANVVAIHHHQSALKRMVELASNDPDNEKATQAFLENSKKLRKNGEHRIIVLRTIEREDGLPPLVDMAVSHPDDTSTVVEFVCNKLGGGINSMRSLNDELASDVEEILEDTLEDEDDNKRQ